MVIHHNEEYGWSSTIIIIIIIIIKNKKNGVSNIKRERSNKRELLRKKNKVRE